MERINSQTVIVSSKELGTRCWSSARFVEGKRCPRVMQCKYPEKKTCKAVDAEIAHLKAQRLKVVIWANAKIIKLVKERTLSG